MLPAFAMAEHVGNQHEASLPSPEYAHVLQFPLGLGIVMAVDNDETRYRLVGLCRDVQIRGYVNVGSALVNDVLDREAIASQLLGGDDLDLLGRVREIAERLTQRGDLFVAECLPVGLCLDAAP